MQAREMGVCSSVGGNFLERDEATSILRDSVTLEMEKSIVSESAIIPLTSSGTSHVRDKDVFLVEATADKVEHAWVSVVTDGLQDHVVSLLNSAETDILHCLDEWQCAAVGSTGLLLQVLVKRVLLIQIVTGPEVHGHDPSDGELWCSAPDVWALIKETRSSLLVEMTVPKHWGVCVEVSHSCGALAHALRKAAASKPL